MPRVVPDIPGTLTPASVAYTRLSRARTLEIVGNSMPPDDIEIRTLLRAGARRGPSRIIVRNPAPDVHDQLRLHRG